MKNKIEELIPRSYLNNLPVSYGLLETSDYKRTEIIRFKSTQHKDEGIQTYLFYKPISNIYLDDEQ